MSDNMTYAEAAALAGPNQAVPAPPRPGQGAAVNGARPQQQPHMPAHLRAAAARPPPNLAVADSLGPSLAPGRHIVAC
jgi:hypothetical protein